ncbi:MAG: PhoU domain-containing protein, partial [Pseudomonadota bacterium]
KRVAMAHFMFNLMETILTLVLINYVVDIVKLTTPNFARQIANAHTATSVMTAIICIPLTGVFVRVVRWIVPVEKNEDESKNLFDVRLLETPSVAINSVKHAIIKMGGMIYSMLKMSCDGIVNKNYKNASHIYELEKNIDQLQGYSFNFIMQVSKLELSGYQALVLNSYRELTNDFERISDHIENIAENSEHSKVCCLDQNSLALVEKLRDHLVNQYTSTYKALSDDDADLASRILESTKQDEKEMFRAHTIEVNQKIKTGEIPAEQGMLLLDLIYNMQRISFHMRRVLYSILRINQRYND